MLFLFPGGATAGKAPRRKRRGKRKTKAERLAARKLREEQEKSTGIVANSNNSDSTVAAASSSPLIDRRSFSAPQQHPVTGGATSLANFAAPAAVGNPLGSVPVAVTELIRSNRIQEIQKLLATADLPVTVHVVHALALEGKFKQLTHTVKALWRRFSVIAATGAAPALQALTAALRALVLHLQQTGQYVSAASICLGIPNQRLLPLLLDVLGHESSSEETEQAAGDQGRLRAAKEILVQMRTGPVCILSIVIAWR